MGNTSPGGEKQAPSTANPQVSPRMSLDQQTSGPGAQGIARKLGLALSYSTKARASLKKRLDRRLGHLSSRYAHVSTFHGWAYRLVMAHGGEAGVGRPQGAPRQQEIRRLIDSCRGQTGESLTDVERVLRRVKTTAVSDEEVIEGLHQAGSPAALAYERALRESDELDFDDLIRLGRQVLEHPGIAALYRQRFPAIMVDEVQDLTLGHLSLATQHGPRSLVFAGDEAQGIYGFAGAQPREVLERIDELAPRRVPLEVSYRSAPCILNVVTALGRPLGAGPLAAAEPEKWEGRSSFDVVRHADSDTEASWTVEHVQALLAQDHIATVAVMARGKPRRSAVDEALAPAAIDHETWDDPTHAVEIRDLLREQADKVQPDSADPVTDLWHLCVGHVEGAGDFELRRQLQEACRQLREQAGLTTDSLLQAIADIRTASDPDTPVGAGLHVLNGHIGKGQEFDAVVVIGLEEYFLPGYAAIKQADDHGDDSEMLEELSVLRVMASRARYQLVFSHADEVPDRQGRRRLRERSRFLELLS
jgi:DNA helicase-2/ATP-dependent DNA helicase PcrA